MGRPLAFGTARLLAGGGWLEGVGDATCLLGGILAFILLDNLSLGYRTHSLRSDGHEWLILLSFLFCVHIFTALQTDDAVPEKRFRARRLDQPT